MKLNKQKIAIIGLGYVGLPLALEFGKKTKVIGFDINEKRINELNKGIDITNESDENEFILANKLSFTNDVNEIIDCNIFIVTVPTPIDKFKTPNLKPLLDASKLISSVLKKNDIVIYESTVYPGCTEEDCVPVLEEGSGLKYNKDFYCGYSPERINPGDKINTLTKIIKVTSGSTHDIADFIDKLYSQIIKAGTFKASSIKVAEASKAIENAQRDLNISFVNELALIFDKMDIDTNEVLDAAASKWNFLKFKPGLVGGHCIGVDPYYLTHKAESLGYYPQVILSGRRVNDYMASFVSNKAIKLMIKKGIKISSSKALILGITFKEDCSDIRNSKIIDIYKELKQFGLEVDVYDPVVDTNLVKIDYGIDCIKSVKVNNYDLVIIAVTHSKFLTIDYKKIVKNKSVIFDLKGMLDKDQTDARL
ncbi:MAG: nucleotide sugar dehydrogenase [Flavobacteriaceae bacterium]|jgi:UDP-N-acetyl-D-glucosamine/UDP-N-acetyl-D-galactosamine dehydrogenase|nr:nucleotide sugar dehydrogenase [Flavobacteriaceae bacterium]